MLNDQGNPMQEIINYVQVGEGHCYNCHEVFNGLIHTCSEDNVITTPCSLKKCGEWYLVREQSTNKNYGTTK